MIDTLIGSSVLTPPALAVEMASVFAWLDERAGG
jgi:hypothetical protein